MRTSKKARRDAQEFARAQMFSGEGAGTRRKVIGAIVESEVARDPNYARQFRSELDKQDMGEHARAAQAERRRIDRNQAISRNAKALATGNTRSMNTSVLVVASAAVVLHQTGADKVIIEKGKQVYYDLKRRLKRQPVIQNVFYMDRQNG